MTSLMVPQPQSAARPATRAGLRILVAVAAAVAFLVAVRLADPAATSADPADNQGQITVPEAELDGADEAFMGALEGVGHSVRIYTTPKGPRYSVLDEFGHIVASDLNADEVHAFLPGYDVQSMQAGALDDDLLLEGPLMLADFE